MCVCVKRHLWTMCTRMESFWKFLDGRLKWWKLRKTMFAAIVSITETGNIKTGRLTPERGLFSSSDSVTFTYLSESHCQNFSLANLTILALVLDASPHIFTFSCILVSKLQEFGPVKFAAQYYRQILRSKSKQNIKTWMNLGIIILCESSQCRRQHCIWDLSYAVPEKANSGDRKQISGCLGLEVRGRDQLQTGMKKLL